VSLVAQDWPQFRGPGGDGHATGSDLAAEWGESKNIRWKASIPGAGWSSPVISGDRIWLTTATKAGTSLRLVSLDKASGKVLLDKEIFAVSDPAKIHAKNSFASPTAIVDGDRLYLHFGMQGTACVRTNGEIVWKTRFDYNHVHGSGGSPILSNGKLYINCDGADSQYVAALDAATGKELWRAGRKTYMAFATPQLIRHGSGVQLISPSAWRTISYDPETGKELWWVTYGEGFSNVPRPVFGHGMVYVATGFYTPEILAVRPDGNGDVTSSHIAWRFGRGVPLTSSPLLAGEELYIVSDNGIATCLDARSGQLRWRERIGGNHSASPTLADGRIYFLSEEGESLVIRPGKTFQKIASNRLDGRFLASPAVSGRAIFLRSAEHLYRIEK
jgi:glucose dehydrogenase